MLFKAVKAGGDGDRGDRCGEGRVTAILHPESAEIQAFRTQVTEVTAVCTTYGRRGKNQKEEPETMRFRAPRYLFRYEVYYLKITFLPLMM